MITSFVDNAIDLPRWNFPRSGFGTKNQRKVPEFLEIPKFHYNTVYNGWKEASTPKSSSICTVVSILCWLVAYRRTGRWWTYDNSIYRTSLASRGKDCCDMWNLSKQCMTGIDRKKCTMCRAVKKNTALLTYHVCHFFCIQPAQKHNTKIWIQTTLLINN